jgi:DNA-binding LacI/PurR family transcriptional regulator
MVASMKDVAKAAGVSQRTVSNVVSGYPHVRPATRERVQRAIEELNYRPNPSARSLREGRTGIIGLAVPEIAAPYFAELADHVQRCAAARGLTLLMDQTGADRERELLVLQGYRSHVIDGLIMSPMAITAKDLRAHQPDMPTVLLGERIRRSSLPTVAIDNVAAAQEMTGYLLASGRTRIAAIGALPTTDSIGPAPRRLEGYLEGLREAGVVADKELIIKTGGWSRAHGYEAVERLIGARTKFDALFCFNDALALGAIRAIYDHGMAVPEDASVTGWDDVEEASYCVPSLTSVSPDKAAIANAAVEALVARIAGRLPKAADCRGAYELIARESSIPV